MANLAPALSADADIRGQRIDLTATWSDPIGVARSFRLLRRRFGYPTDAGDGLVVVDLGDLFVVPPPRMVTAATSTNPIQITTDQPHGLSSGDVVVIADVTGVAPVGGGSAANGEWTVAFIDPYNFTLTGSAGNGLSAYAGGGVASQPPTTAPWGRIDRTRYYLLDDLAEGGVLEAELALYYVIETDAQPVQVAVTAYYPPDSNSPSALLPDDQAVSRIVFTSVTHVDTVTTSNASFGLVTTITIWTKPGLGAEAQAAMLVASTQGVNLGPKTLVEDYTQPDPGTGEPPLQIPTWQPNPSQIVFTPTAQFITNATAASPIEITTQYPHGLSTGATVVIQNVSVVGANGSWPIQVTGPTTFTLAGRVGTGTYNGGGTATPLATTLPFLGQELQRTGSTLQALQPLVVDFVTGVVTMTVTGATNSTPIQITTASPHGLSDGDQVVISDVTGNTAANGEWIVAVVDALNFTLTTLQQAPPSGNGTWKGGGVVALPIRSVEVTETANPDTGEIGRSIDAVDLEPPQRALTGFSPGLTPGVTYYYAGWEDTGGGYPAASLVSAFSIATGSHGFSDRLYALVPGVHRFYDDPASGPQPGSGQLGSFQLKRFLQVMGPALDQAWSTAGAQRTLSDIFNTRADFLPYLGHWIGWELDRTRSTQRQRTDILFAPDVYQSLGTVPNIQALVHRSTGWTCQAKEFVNNVFLTNSVEQIRLCEIWQMPPVPVASGTPSYPLPYPLPLQNPPPVQTQVTQAVSDSIDARPAVAIEPSGTPPQWIFWHSRRPDNHLKPSTRRQIWMQSLDAVYPLTNPLDPMVPVMQGAPDDADGLTYTDEWPTAIADTGLSLVRLFWISDREGSPGIWTRTLQVGGLPPISDATQLTNHRAGDHCPFVVRDAAQNLWVFFHSSRRGPTDIWAITLPFGSTSWTLPLRITTGNPRDRMPTAFVDATGQLNLLWSADLGDRSRILQATFTGTKWNVNPTPVSSLANDATTYRDEAPSAVRWNNQVWAYFSSNRDGLYRIYASQLTGSTWSAPVPVTSGRHEEAEPAAFVDAAGQLRLAYRSTQGGEQYQSRTVDMNDLGAIQRGLVTDRWHYTYSNQIRIDFNNDPNSLAVQQDSPYARDVVGLYIMPDESQSLDDQDRVKALVEPFRPLPVIFTWFVQPALVKEQQIYTSTDIQEAWNDSPSEPAGSLKSWLNGLDYLGPVNDLYHPVSLPNWSVFHTNTPADVTGSPAKKTWYPPFQ